MRFFAVVSATAFAASPVSKVLELIASLEQRVIHEGEVENQQYEAFGDWCTATTTELRHEIENGTDDSAQLKATIEKASADASTASARIEELGQGISAAEADLAAATNVRNTQNKDFLAEQASTKETIDALSRAHQVLSKHLSNPDAASLAQITTSLEALVDAHTVSAADKRKLTQFMQSDAINQPSVKAYESHSGSILTTIEDMQEKAEDLLNEIERGEMKAQHDFDMVKQSLDNSIKAQNEDLDEQRKALAAAQEVKATAEGDKAATDKELAADQQQLSDTKLDCAAKAEDWAASQQSRSEELAALKQAQDVIKSMTGGANTRQYKEFMQLAARDSANVHQIYKSIKAMASQDQSLGLAQLAARIRVAESSKDVFGKVKGLIEGMIGKLEKEANEDASHKAFCDKEISESEAKRDKHQSTVDKLSTRIDKNTATIAKTKEEIATLQAELAKLAKMQSEMDAMRTAHHDEYVASKADFEAGLSGIQQALKVLREYYASDASLVQQPAVSVHRKNSDASTGIIGLLETAEGDFARSLAEGDANETQEQQHYDKVSQDNRVSKTQKEADVKHKDAEVQRLTERVGEQNGDRSGVQAELDAVHEYLEKLRPQCTVVPESYEERKARREQEIQGLKSALEILESEAAPSFLQKRRV
jgi:chromosome segregation ATPase